MQGTSHRGGIRPPAGEGTTTLLARAVFATLNAGVLELLGLPGQEASTAALAGDLFVSVHAGSSPALTAVWSEDREELKGFLEATFDRQFVG